MFHVKHPLPVLADPPASPARPMCQIMLYRGGGWTVPGARLYIAVSRIQPLSVGQRRSHERDALS